MTEQLPCDLGCGRTAAMRVGRLNLCDRCADELPELDIPGPRLRFEDVIVPERSREDEAL